MGSTSEDRSGGQAAAAPEETVWPAHSGVGGVSLAVERARPADRSPDAARAALARWSEAPAQAFPYADVLGYYRAVGRNHADDELLAELRAVGERLTPAAPAYGEERLLADWLPMTYDRTDGDYDSYIGTTVFDSLVEQAGPGRRVEAVDGFTAVAVADLVAIEADALAAAPDAPRAYARTRAAARTLTRIGDYLPYAAAESEDLAQLRTVLSVQSAADILAAVAAKAAQSTAARFPVIHRKAVELTLIPTTRLHDELMFIRSIQIFEGIYQQVARGVEAASAGLERGDVAAVCELLADAAARIEATPILYRVLTGMPVESFAVIRGYTDGRSAIQSRWYRQVEAFCMPGQPMPTGKKIPDVRVEGPGLDAAFVARAAALHTDDARRVAEAMLRLDKAWGAMKRNHWGLTLKIIGDVPGTGGISGASYLKTAAQVPLFPRLRRDAGAEGASHTTTDEGVH
ncbi:hypothetical protein [Streptomyces sp. NPDC048155]|uniref:hypothetical protein n=1 Tax=Streptomyces sp. NPDC048155 TaxID=3154818 RepID=UPI0033FE6F04